MSASQHAFDIFRKALSDHLKVELNPDFELAGMITYKLMNNMPVVVKIGSDTPSAITVAVDLSSKTVTFAGNPIPTPPSADWQSFASIIQTLRMLRSL